jgi:hypothetical protein
MFCLFESGDQILRDGGNISIHGDSIDVEAHSIPIMTDISPI